MERLKLLQAFGRLRWRSPSVLSPLLEKLVQKVAQHCNIRSRKDWNAVPQLHRTPFGSILMVPPSYLRSLPHDSELDCINVAALGGILYE